MSDYVKILDLENEVEANLLEAVLKERAIPHVIRTYHDSAFDGLYQMHLGFGFVEAPREEGERINEIYRDVVKNRTSYRLVEDEKERTQDQPEPKRATKKAAKIGGALAVVLGGIALYFALEYEGLKSNLDFVARSGRTDVRYEWNAREKAYVGYFKKTGKIGYRFFDVDGNGSFETMAHYDWDGVRQTEETDADGDGYADRFVRRYASGERAVWMDADGDGAPDTVELHFRDGRREIIDVGRDLFKARR